MAKVSFFRGPNANSLPIRDGQFLIDTETGAMFLDISDTERKALGGGGTSDIEEMSTDEINAMFAEGTNPTEGIYLHEPMADEEIDAIFAE